MDISNTTEKTEPNNHVDSQNHQLFLQESSKINMLGSNNNFQPPFYDESYDNDQNEESTLKKATSSEYFCEVDAFETNEREVSVNNGDDSQIFDQGCERV